jgi:putative DNA primase/helicase
MAHPLCAAYMVKVSSFHTKGSSMTKLPDMTQEELEAAKGKPDVTFDPVQELAKLSPMEYDQARESKAKELGVRVGTLDQEVAKVRGDVAENNQDSVVEEISPWSEHVDGNTLLTELAETIDRYVVLPTGAGTALPIWSLGSYCMDAWSTWPKLLITSPEKRCGKSTLLEVVEGIVYRALLTSNISPSAIFRCIEEWAPSLLIDEADTFAKDNDELNGIINSGHRKRTATMTTPSVR